MPPSLLQFSMYFVTSCDSNPLVPEGNKPIWPPIWGPDGWLSLLPILSSFVRQDPSRQHGDTTSSSRNTQYNWPQWTHQTSLQVVTKPENHSLLRKEKRNALTMPEECFFKLFHYASVPLHSDQLATLSSLHFFVSKTKQAGQSRKPSLMNFLSSFKS